MDKNENVNFLAKRVYRRSTNTTSSLLFTAAVNSQEKQNDLQTVLIFKEKRRSIVI